MALSICYFHSSGVLLTCRQRLLWLDRGCGIDISSCSGAGSSGWTYEVERAWSVGSGMQRHYPVGAQDCYIHFPEVLPSCGGHSKGPVRAFVVLLATAVLRAALGIGVRFWTHWQQQQQQQEDLHSFRALHAEALSWGL
eukprot:TRINITY_DN6376_c0_g1_i3.p1 TRINITY_DN6376_c0_g1~~TRINITY_DN6376_c0_g1_i3.p1  ORF type:complete len:139 (-),score=20.01 TRINITY_DN6376_c0_g1_i3:183-599(-)